MTNGYYNFDCRVVNNSTSSSVAMAAYRSGEKLYSEKDGETKSYKVREVQPQSFILKPKHAPTWTLNRERLWNEVERYEKRDGSQIARSLLLSLPNQFNEEQQFELTREYVQENFVDEGMVADVSIHRDEKNNPHAHILLTMREFNQDGTWNKNKSKRVPVLDKDGNQVLNEKGWKVTKSVKVNDWNSKETLKMWREKFAEKLNEKSKEHGYDLTFSHKSYEDQGLEIKPTERLSLENYQYEKRLKDEALEQGRKYEPQTYFGKKNEEIKLYNEKVIQASKKHSSVISIDDYKNEKDINETFGIEKRNNRPLTIKEVNAHKSIGKRAKTYVDFNIANRIFNEFHNSRNSWKLQLDTERTNLDVSERFYKKVLIEYREDKASVKKYGYSLDTFQDDIKKQVNDLRNRQDVFKNKQLQFDNLKQDSRIVYDYQKDVLEAEFAVVYEGANVQEVSLEEKAFALDTMKDTNEIIPFNELKEHYQTRAKQNEHMIIPLWKQAKQTITSIKIYQRSIDKFTRMDKDIPELYNEIIKARTFADLKEQYEGYIRDIEPYINVDLEKKGFARDIQNYDIETKVTLLEAYERLSEVEKEQLNHVQFLKDVQAQQETVYNQLDNDKGNDSKAHIKQNMKEQTKNIINQLFMAIQQQAQHEQSRDSGRNKRDRSAQRRRKGSDGREL